MNYQNSNDKTTRVLVVCIIIAAAVMMVFVGLCISMIIPRPAPSSETDTAIQTTEPVTTPSSLPMPEPNPEPVPKDGPRADAIPGYDISAPSFYEDAPYTVYSRVGSSVLNFRTGPSESHQVIKKLKNNYALVVYGYNFDRSWAYVYDGASGGCAWVSAEYISK